MSATYFSVPAAETIAMTVAAGGNYDYITVVYGRGAGDFMRYPPVITIDYRADTSDLQLPVRGQLVVVEVVRATPEDEIGVYDLIDRLEQCGARRVIMLHDAVAYWWSFAKGTEGATSTEKALKWLAKVRRNNPRLTPGEKQMMRLLGHCRKPYSAAAAAQAILEKMRAAQDQPKQLETIK